MQRIDNRLVYSTTDIVGALECRHLAHLERAVVDGHLKRPMRTDPVLDRIAQRGIEHEVRFLAELSRDDLTVVKIPRYETLPRAERVARGREATIEAMRAGADVIYQAVLVLRHSVSFGLVSAVTAGSDDVASAEAALRRLRSDQLGTLLAALISATFDLLPLYNRRIPGHDQTED